MYYKTTLKNHTKGKAKNSFNQESKLETTQKYKFRKAYFEMDQILEGCIEKTCIKSKLQTSILAPLFENLFLYYGKRKY